LSGNENHFQHQGVIMGIRTEYVTLTVSDGSTMRAWVARPEASNAQPGLLLFQEAFGVNAHIRELTERFAGEGYLAIAPELFHRTAPGFEGRYDDLPATRGHMRALDDVKIEADQRAAHAWLLANGVRQRQVAAVGFCMGGRAAFLATLVLPVACGVSFYGGGIAPSANNPGLLGRAGELQAPVLCFWGGLDKHITVDQVRLVTDTLRRAERQFVNVEISDADHGFFCDARSSYNANAAAEAWPLAMAFLRTQLAVASRQ
jgi:carboxymethylenebutenolidase